MKKVSQRQLKKHPKQYHKINLPKNPSKGEEYTKTIGDRKITFQATGKTGFGKWKIIKNVSKD